MINDIKDLLASLSGGRPLVVALLVIAICFLLLRPRRKQQPSPAAAPGAGSSSGAAGVPQQKLPALSLSTRDILLEFCNGVPQLKQEPRPVQHGAALALGDHQAIGATAWAGWTPPSLLTPERSLGRPVSLTRRRAARLTAPTSGGLPPL